MDHFAHLKPFSKIAGNLSKYFGKQPQVKRRPSIDIEDQSESNDESTETDFFSQEDSQPQFEYYRTHQDLKRSVTWEMAPVAMVPSPAAGAENAVDFQNSRFVCAKADWHAVEAGDLELRKGQYYEAAHVRFMPTLCLSLGRQVCKVSAEEVTQRNTDFLKKRNVRQFAGGKGRDRRCPCMPSICDVFSQCFEDGWWLGRNSDGVVGVFPSNFVEVIETSWF